MTTRQHDDWLASFVDWAAPVGEAPLDILWWVGVSTIAGALRRRVWIDQRTFQWVPNFYIVAVAPPGIISKTTTANVGFRLLKQVEGIHFGPDIASWQALVQAMGKLGEDVELRDGSHLPMSAVTLAIDEYGTFIDPFDRQQVDNLTNLWDGKAGTIWKASKTQGEDFLHYPWLNLFACTTPNWLETNFPESFLASGFMSRHIFLFANQKRQRIALPSRIKVKGYEEGEKRLVTDLTDIAGMAGPFKFTSGAEDWMEIWYNDHWDKYEKESRERLGFPARKQTHLAKLAMILSAARGDFPALTVEHLEEANQRLNDVEPGIKRVLSLIGTTNITRASREIVEAMEQYKAGGKAAVLKRDVYGKFFFRRLSHIEFDEALAGAVGAGYVEESPDRTTLKLLKPLER